MSKENLTPEEKHESLRDKFRQHNEKSCFWDESAEDVPYSQYYVEWLEGQLLLFLEQNQQTIEDALDFMENYRERKSTEHLVDYRAAMMTDFANQRESKRSQTHFDEFCEAFKSSAHKCISSDSDEDFMDFVLDIINEARKTLKP